MKRRPHAILVPVVVAMGAASLHAQTPADPATQQFAFAYRLFQRNENKLAAEAFDEYLGKFSKDERRGDALYYRALIAQRVGDPQAAVKFLADAPAGKLVPEHAVLLLRGQLYCDLGQYDQAIASLEKIKVEKLDTSAKASTLFLTGSAYRGAGNATAAAKSLNAAAEIDSPLRARAYLEAARLEIQIDKPNEALETLSKAAAVADSEVTPEAARLGGDVAFRLGQFARAVDFYRAVVNSHQSSPHFGPCVLGILWSQLSAKQYAEVGKTFDAYKDALPAADKPMAFYLAGSALQDSGKHEQAIAVLTALPQGVAEAPYDKALLKAASSQFELNQLDAMAQTLQTLQTRHPGSPLNADGAFLLAAADARRGEPAKGAARLTEIIDQGDKHPYHVQAIFQRAKLYAATSQPEPAAADFASFLDLVRQNPANTPAESMVVEAGLRLAAIQQQLGKDEGAIATTDWLLTRKLEPFAEQEAMYRKAMAQVRLQRLEPALETLTKLVSKHPQNAFVAETRYYRGLLLMSLQKPDDAVADLQTATAASPAGVAPLAEPLQINALRLMAIRQREKPESAEAALVTLTRLEKIVGIAKLLPDELLWLARNAAASQKPAESLRVLAPLLDAKSNAPGSARSEATLLAARARRDLKEPQAALESYRQVVAMGQGFELQARLELAKTLRDSGQSDEALAEYAGLIYAPPSAIASQAIFDSALIQRDIARTRRTAGDTTGAQAAAQESYKLLKRLVLLYAFPQLSPTPELGFIELAEVEIELSTPTAEVNRTLNELIEKFGDSPYATYAKAILAYRDGKKGDAIFLLKKLNEKTATLDPRLGQRVTRQLKALEGQS